MNSGRSRGVSPIATTAALSVAILLAATGSYIGETMQRSSASPSTEDREPLQARRYAEIEDKDANGRPDWQDELARSGVVISASTTAGLRTEDDPVSGMGERLLSSFFTGYQSLKQLDSYAPSQTQELANALAKNFKAPESAVDHDASGFATDADSSPKRLLQYRSDMRIALEGMVDLEAEPEFTLFARFVQTNDPRWLDELTKAAEKYRTAEANLLKVTVPVAAIEAHVRATNAVGSFAQTLERLVRFANDPLASVALLRTYNDAEREFLLAFDALAKFYAENTSGN